MLNHTALIVDPPSDSPATATEDSRAVDELDILADVQLAQIPSEECFELKKHVLTFSVQFQRYPAS